VIKPSMRLVLGASALLVLAGCPSPPPKPPPPEEKPLPPPEEKPVEKKTPPDAVVGAATFREHHCLLRQAKTVECWGRNLYGQLGNGGKDDSAELVSVTGLTDARVVVVGRDFSCALRETGGVTCWGNNEDGQLGDGKGVEPGAKSAALVEVTGVAGVKQLVAGEYHACVLDGGGSVQCWGNGADGQLGRSVKRATGTAGVVGDLGRVKQVSTGASHACALESSGSVKCWGRNSEGQLGIGKSGSRSNATAVVGLDDVKQLASGWTHSCALKNDGTVVCWGDNTSMQLGPKGGSERRAQAPIEVPGLSDIKRIAAGGRHTCVSDAAGKTSCWGDNTKGQLGAAAGAAQAAPVEAAAGKKALSFALGDAQSCAVLPKGKLACWGALTNEIAPSGG
jgi:alpha-tubulin suppressor-like RCC1 family protein